MENRIERKTLFIYPNLREMETIRSEKIVDLISDISRIITEVNTDLSQLIRMGCFTSVNCLPLVEMAELNQDIKHVEQSEKKLQRVRICINKYHDVSYYSFYDKVFENKNDLDISHLVGLNIVSDNINKVVFLPDTSEKFDVIVETSLDSLYHVLISIMLDISLYHYFNLSNDLNDRKKFSIEKCKYLTQSLDDFQSIYGSKPELLRDSKYLPFSYKGTLALKRRKRIESKKESLNQTINEYFRFLTSVLCTKVPVKQNGSIVHPDEITNRSHLSYIDLYIDKNLDLIKDSNVLIFLKNDGKTIDLSDIIVIKLNIVEITPVQDWIDKIKFNLSGYSIYEILFNGDDVE